MAENFRLSPRSVGMHHDTTASIESELSQHNIAAQSYRIGGSMPYRAKGGGEIAARGQRRNGTGVRSPKAPPYSESWIRRYGG
jgi:hypothetical protein